MTVDRDFSPEQEEVIRLRIVKHMLRTLERVQRLTRVHHEHVADYLRPHLKAQHLVELSCYLEKVGAHMLQQQTDRKCAGCGSALEYTFDGLEMQLRFVRGDALYCSAKCRQKAYRKRVTAKSSRAKAKPSRVTALPA